MKTLVLALTLMLAACGTPTVLTTKMVPCGDGVPDMVKSEPCLTPEVASPGTTFEQALATSKAEKTELQNCSVKVKTLQQILANCDAEVSNFNARTK